jgi:hypothetical protein
MSSGTDLAFWGDGNVQRHGAPNLQGLCKRRHHWFNFVDKILICYFLLDALGGISR